jgi:acyl-CoA synthetase (AMP-forming)/AMP-acid ligase II
MPTGSRKKMTSCRSASSSAARLCPTRHVRAFETQFGVEVLHAWGMTEMSPLGTVCNLLPEHAARTRSTSASTYKLKQGRPPLRRRDEDHR